MCTRCIYDDSLPNIEFDERGVCNYCDQVDSLKEQYGTGIFKGKKIFDEIIEEIKSCGKGQPYDCAVGVSGGADSSYLLVKSIEWGSRPLAVHLDYTWNSAVATENIRKITFATGVDLYTHVVSNKEVDDIKKAFLLSGVPEFDADTDIAYVQVIRSAAAKHGIKYIFEGHLFVTENWTPSIGQ